MANVRIAEGQVRAVSRYARISPDKGRQVVQHIRGLPVERARQILAFSPKGAAAQVLKTLDSAVANAENNHGLDPDELVVTAAVVDEGPVLRRFRPRAMGRATPIRKRMSHITVIVGLPETQPKRRGGKPRKRPAAASNTSAAGGGASPDASGGNEQE